MQQNTVAGCCAPSVFIAILAYLPPVENKPWTVQVCTINSSSLQLFSVSGGSGVNNQKRFACIRENKSENRSGKLAAIEGKGNKLPGINHGWQITARKKRTEREGNCSGSQDDKAVVAPHKMYSCTNCIQTYSALCSALNIKKWKGKLKLQLPNTKVDVAQKHQILRQQCFLKTRCSVGRTMLPSVVWYNKIFILKGF